MSREPPAVFERQDDDVLDTWFSSALFPLASFGWPDKLDKRYYPLSVMETGADILFFWVARMAMICSEMEPDLGCPFGRVVLHPMVRDKFGRKMSKSVGNVIDPMNLIEGQTLADMLAAAEVNTSKLSERELSLSMQYLKKEFPEVGCLFIWFCFFSFFSWFIRDFQNVVLMLCDLLWLTVKAGSL